MKIVIVGCGNVGMAYAYALVNQPSRVDELVLIDINQAKCEGEAADLRHALPFSPTGMKIKAGNYSDCKDAHILCICAGKNQEIGETRLDLIHKNTRVFEEILKQVIASGFQGIYLIATNPVDVMSYVTYRLTGDPKKVIGSGTSLDTARLKHLVGKELNINARNVHAYVLGEHGDSEMIPWSKATIGVKDISDYLSEEKMKDLQIEVRDSAYDIIKKKGSTCYGIGVCLLTITNSILDNDNAILTVSTYHKESNTFISLPTILSRQGVREVIQVDFNEVEKEKFAHSLKTLANITNSLKF